MISRWIKFIVPLKYSLPSKHQIRNSALCFVASILVGVGINEILGLLLLGVSIWLGISASKQFRRELLSSQSPEYKAHLKDYLSGARDDRPVWPPPQKEE